MRTTISLAWPVLEALHLGKVEVKTLDIEGTASLKPVVGEGEVINQLRLHTDTL